MSPNGYRGCWFHFQDKDRNVPYIDVSLSTMQLCLALETQGLSTCIINWPEDKQSNYSLRKLNYIEKYEKLVFLMP